MQCLPGDAGERRPSDRCQNGDDHPSLGWQTPAIAGASVIVTNYNYGRFLGAALASALDQRPAAQVVVVDDGSTDESREIIASYGSHLVAVLKENAGQASAFNAGLEVANGDSVIFLDADDILLPGAIARVLGSLADPSIAKVHWQMREFGESGGPGTDLMPRERLMGGDLRDAVIRRGPEAINYPPTSGNAWNRRFLDAVFPIAERGLERAGADALLSTLAPLYGRIAVEEPLSAYRKHPGSNYGGQTFDVRLALQRQLYDRCCDALARECVRRGIVIDRSAWDEASWVVPLEDMVRILHQHVPRGQRFILIDDAEFDLDETGGRPAVPLIARDGVYWGPPNDSFAAIEALDHRIAEGIEFLALAPSSRWWLDEYPEFFGHLSGRAEILVDNERLSLYRLRKR